MRYHRQNSICGILDRTAYAVLLVKRHMRQLLRNIILFNPKTAY